MRGRGQPPFVVERHPIAVHVRRKLSPKDKGMLAPEWLETPAVDMAGPGIRLFRFEDEFLGE